MFFRLFHLFHSSTCACCANLYRHSVGSDFSAQKIGLFELFLHQWCQEIGLIQ